MSEQEKAVKAKKVTVEVTIEKLTELVNEGKTKEEIGSYYNLNTAATTRLLKDAGLKVKFTRKVTPAFVLIKSTNTVVTDENEIPEVTNAKPKAVKKNIDDDLLSVKNKEEDLTDNSTDNDW